MRKLLLLLMIVPMIGFGQSKKTAVVSATNMNILYAYLENPIRVAVPGVALSEISISVDNGTVTKQSDGNYIVKPIKTGKSIISVYVNNSGKREKYMDKEYRVKSVPSPMIIPILNDEILSISELGSQTFKINLADFDLPVKFSISEFTVVCIGSKRVETKVKGYKLSEAARDQINYLRKGQTVIFKDFVVYQHNNENKMSLSQSFVYTIK